MHIKLHMHIYMHTHKHAYPYIHLHMLFYTTIHTKTRIWFVKTYICIFEHMQLDVHRYTHGNIHKPATMSMCTCMYMRMEIKNNEQHVLTGGRNDMNGACMCFAQQQRNS